MSNVSLLFGVFQELGCKPTCKPWKERQGVPFLSPQRPQEVADGALPLPPVPPARLSHDPSQAMPAVWSRPHHRALGPCAALQQPKLAALEWGSPGAHAHGQWLSVGFADTKHAADTVIICTNLHGFGTSPTTSPSEMVMFGIYLFGDAWEDAVVGLGAAAEVGEESPCPSPVPAAQPRVLVPSHQRWGCGHVL